MTSSKTINMDMMLINPSTVVSANKSTSQLFPQNEAILRKIFKYLKQDDLAECSIVCSAWYIAVTPLLYRRVTLNSLEGVYLFSDLINDIYTNVKLGSLVRDVNFGGFFHDGEWNFLLEIIARLIYRCPRIINIRTIDNESLKKVIVKVLSELPNTTNRFKRISSIPVLLGNKDYEHCLDKYSTSLTEVSLDADQLTLDSVLRFPNLTRLHVDEISSRSMTFYSLLDALPSLQELSINYPLNEYHFQAYFPLRFYPVLRSLDLKFEISNNFHHLQVMHLLSFFTNLRRLSISLTDGANSSLRQEQMYAIEETVSLIHQLGNSCVDVCFRNRNSNDLSVSLYLQCILNSVIPQILANNGSHILSMSFNEDSCRGDYIRYSTFENPLLKNTQMHQITLPSRINKDLASSVIQQAGKYLTSLQFVCRDTSNTFEVDSSWLLLTALEECPQVNKLVLHGSDGFDCESPISSQTILELQLINPRFTFLMPTHAPFHFSNLQKIYIQISLEEYWTDEVYFNMPGNNLKEFFIDIGDSNDNKILAEALFIIELKFDQDEEYTSLCFRHRNQALKQVYNGHDEEIRSSSKIFRMNLEFNCLDTLLFRHGDYSTKLWHKRRISS